MVSFVLDLVFVYQYLIIVNLYVIFVSCEFVFLNDGYDDCCDWSVFDKNKGISGIM